MWFWLSVEDQGPSVDCEPNTAPQPTLEACVESMMVGTTLPPFFFYQLSSDLASRERDMVAKLPTGSL